MRVVLDTNVVVSGLNFPGNERLVLNWLYAGGSSGTFPSLSWMKSQGSWAASSGGMKPEHPKPFAL